MRKLLLATLIFFLSATVWAAGVPYPGYVEVEDVDGLNAEKVPFDNTTAALPDAPDNVQDAIEKLDAAVDAVDSGTITDLDNLPGDTVDDDKIDSSLINTATSTGPGVASFSNSFFKVTIDGVVSIISGVFQAASAVLTDLATGSPTGTYDFSGATITYGLETSDIPDLSATYATSGIYQPADDDLTDLADGSLPATKIQIADIDEVFTASTVETALSELKGDISGIGGGHDAVTIGTANGLSLSTQELSLAAATNSTPGAMTAAQVTALEAIDTEAELEALLELADLQGNLAASRIDSGVFDNARINFASPGAIGGTTAAAATFTTVTASAFESNAADGDHYTNLGNTNDYDETKSDGDMWYNRTSDLLKVYDGAEDDIVITDDAFTGNTETGIAVTPQSDGTVDFVVDFTGHDIGAATATTPAENDNDTSVATTAYVQGELTLEPIIALFKPEDVYDNNTSHVIILDPYVSEAITITEIRGSCLADPATELDMDLMYADAVIGLANATVIDAIDTVSGVTTQTTITSGSVAAGKCIYIRINADPDDTIDQYSISIMRE